MRGRIQDRNVWLIYLTIFLLGLAYGISISLTAIFLDARGYTKPQIGSLAAWFALGIVVLAMPMGALIRRFSARTSLMVALLGYGVVVTAFPFLPGYHSIAAVRFCDGAFSAGVWVSCETILLSRSGSENKAFITSLYAIAMALGYIVGPALAQVIAHFVSMPAAFVTAGVFAASAAVVVYARLDADVVDAHGEAAALAAGEPESPALAILWRIKTSCLATFAYGYFQASVVLFLPLYLIERKGIAKDQTILIPAAFAAGMLLFSNLAGRLGDKYGHLGVMRVLSVIGTLMIAGFVFLDSYAWMMVAVFIAGATLASISPVSLALQGVITAPRDYSRSNAIYNVFYASGMLLGPPVSSRIYEARGGSTMLWHLAAMWVVVTLFTVVFFRDDPAVQARRAELRPA